MSTIAEDEMDNDLLFEEVKHYFLDDKVLREQMITDGFSTKVHILSENGYLPLLPILLSKLTSKDWFIRDACLMAAGFHYNLDEDMLDKIKTVLSSDPEGSVRLTAVGVINNQLQSIDDSVVNAFKKESDTTVKFLMLSGLLYKIGVSYSDAEEIRALLDSKYQE